MRVVQQGDRVQIQYLKRFDGDPGFPPQGKGYAELTAGANHRRLPGLGLALVGLTEGESRTVVIPVQQAYGAHHARRVYRLHPERFMEFVDLSVGKWVRISDRRKRRRLVRIVALRENMVVVDANHRRAGQSMEVVVEVIAIRGPKATSATGSGTKKQTPYAEMQFREDTWIDDGGQN